MRPREDLVERFWRFVRKSESPEGCWLWVGRTLDKAGYGYIMIQDNSAGCGRRALKVSRLSWKIAHGKEAPGNVCHRCDTPACVNPDHLFVGTDQDNVRDMTRKCRNVFQHRNPSKKLTVLDVFVIKLFRQLNVPLKSLSKKFGVTQGTISRIASGARRGERSWQ